MFNWHQNTKNEKKSKNSKMQKNNGNSEQFNILPLFLICSLSFFLKVQ